MLVSITSAIIHYYFAAEKLYMIRPVIGITFELVPEPTAYVPKTTKWWKDLLWHKLSAQMCFVIDLFALGSARNLIYMNIEQNLMRIYAGLWHLLRAVD